VRQRLVNVRSFQDIAKYLPELGELCNGQVKQHANS
jgi:hypothetical protein